MKWKVRDTATCGRVELNVGVEWQSVRTAVNVESERV